MTHLLARTWNPAHAMADTFWLVDWPSDEDPSDLWLARLHNLSSKWTNPDLTRHFSSALINVTTSHNKIINIHYTTMHYPVTVFLFIKEKRYTNNKLHNVSNSIKIFQGINESRSIILSWPYTRLYIGTQIVSGNFSLHLLKHCRKVKSRKYGGINHYNWNIDVCETLMAPFPNLSRIGLTFDLDLWPTNLNIDRNHLLSKDYLPTKFEASGVKRSWVISCTRLRETDIPTEGPMDRLTDTCKAICPSFFKGGGHNYNQHDFCTDTFSKRNSWNLDLFKDF